MDASQYKDYVLTLLFVKYVSDKYASGRNSLLRIPEGGSFADMVKLKGNKEIGDKINTIIARIAEANELQGVIDVADFNDEDRLGRGQEMVDRLSRLVALFEGLDLRANRAEGDDLLGDAYEFLMRKFATESGKSKGQFYTPAEVSRIMARVLGVTSETRQDQTAYDPTCGSGSLLLKVADEAPRGLTLYGQEMDNATAALARMNMILHGQPTAEIQKGNTLAHPHWPGSGPNSLKQFDFVVSNPPFSQKNWINGVNVADDQFSRFTLGTPPDKNGDYAFLLHILTSLKSTGKAAVILPHGVLFRGGSEAVIRRNLIRGGYIKGIIGLPPNLFYGTGIPACIIVLDKEHAGARTGIFMIDASRGFMKDGNKNRLRHQDIHKIVDVFNRQIELPRYSRMITTREIEENDWNLNIPRYIDASEPEDLHDLDAHLNGGIPRRDVDALERYWRVLPGAREALFAPGDRAGYLTARLPAGQIKKAILTHPDFDAFADGVRKIFSEWWSTSDPKLTELSIGVKPKALKGLIHEVSENLLARFERVELIDKYDLYQHLMDYWDETMQDDVWAISQEGWLGAARPRLIVEEKENKSKETPDFVIDRKKFKVDLIPPAVIVARWFAAEREQLEALQAAKEAISAELETLIEDESGEEGLLEEARNEKGKITKASLKTRLAEINLMPDSDEERDILLHCQSLLEKEEAAESRIKDATRKLDAAVFARYGKLTEEEARSLVVYDKWLATIEASVIGEVERVTRELAGRVKALEERYADPLPKLVEQVTLFTARVEEHLHRMGLVWGSEV
jgi:type I restriction enzyme M protein